MPKCVWKLHWHHLLNHYIILLLQKSDNVHQCVLCVCVCVPWCRCSELRNNNWKYSHVVWLHSGYVLEFSSMGNNDTLSLCWSLCKGFRTLNCFIRMWGRKIIRPPNMEAKLVKTRIQGLICKTNFITRAIFFLVWKCVSPEHSFGLHLYLDTHIPAFPTSAITTFNSLWSPHSL